MSGFESNKEGEGDRPLEIKKLLTKVFPEWAEREFVTDEEFDLGSYGGKDPVLCYLGDELIGIMIASPAEAHLVNLLGERTGSSLSEENIIEINGVAVDPDHRSSGVYRFMMEKLFEKNPDIQVIVGSTPNPLAAIARANTLADIDDQGFVTMWGGNQIPFSTLDYMDILRLESLANSYLGTIGDGRYPKGFLHSNYSAGYVYSMFNRSYEKAGPNIQFPQNIESVLKNLTDMASVKSRFVKPEHFNLDLGHLFIPQAVLISVREDLVRSRSK